MVELVHHDPARSGAVRRVLTANGYRVVPGGLGIPVDVLVTSTGVRAADHRDVPVLILSSATSPGVAARASTSAGTVVLTVIEHRLLRALGVRIGQVASRRSLVDLTWAPGSRVARNTLDSHIRHLRAKLASIGSPCRIETVHGAGFRLAMLGA